MIPLRSEKSPRGFGHPRAEHANTIASRSAALVLAAHEAGVYWSIENPADSLLWLLREYAQLAKLPGVREIYFDQCAYGGESYKPTKVLTNAPWLFHCNRRCSDVPPHSHVRLRGLVEDHREGASGLVWRTTLAAEYPEGLCNAWAKALCAWLRDSWRPVVTAGEEQPPLVRVGRFGNALVAKSLVDEAAVAS